MTLKEKITNIGRKARKAQYAAALLSTDKKNSILRAMAVEIRSQKDEIKKENLKDIKAAQRLKLAPAMIDRLTLNDKRIEEMASGLEDIADLPDPVGQVVKSWERPNGLKISKVRIPIGVIAMIYESRPNVTVDAASLCFKSGNAIVLRGGSEAINSNIFLAKLMRRVLEKNNISKEVIQIVDTTERKTIPILAGMTGVIDLIIPRGGSELMKKIDVCAKVPVLKHDRGTCHVYVDTSADLNMAENITFNSKVQRPGVCNAAETLLVHEKVAEEFLPKMISRLKAAGVEIRGCPKTKKIVHGIKSAKEEDWPMEYLDLILSVRIVPNIDKAIEHIRRYGSLHTEAIVTNDDVAAKKFVRELDSSSIMVNASTRFSDGGEYGMGAEIGISTTKIHAFGPMGLEELTTTKFVVHGNGQIRI